MIRWMARVLLRGGVAMLILCLLVRPAIRTPDGMMGDNLAIIACGLLIVISGLYIRFGRTDDDDEQPTGRIFPRPPRPHSPERH